jgi:hypothetical protein
MARATLLLGLALAAGAAAWSGPVGQKASGGPGLPQELRYFVEPSGLWIAANPRADEAGQPSEFGCQYAFGLGGELVTLRLFAAFPDGQERDLWHYVTSRDPRTGRVRVHGFGLGGAWLAGTRGPDEAALELFGVDAAGAELRVRESRTILGPDAFRGTSTRTEPDGRQTTSEYVWERQSSGGVPPQGPR